MKRLNKILIAGTLCFSLGYIANDIVRESGTELAGSAFALPRSVTHNFGYPSRSEDITRRPLLRVSYNFSACPDIKKAYLSVRRAHKRGKGQTDEWGMEKDLLKVFGLLESLKNAYCP